MQHVMFTIPGRIKGKGRPKFARRGTFVHAYTPSETMTSEAVVRSFGQEAMYGRAPFEGPLILDVTVTINRPDSWSKKKKAQAFYVTGKPDVDNVCKLIGDALNGITWKDDSQICDLHFRRRYRDGCGETVEIRIFAPGQGEPELMSQPNLETQHRTPRHCDLETHKMEACQPSVETQRHEACQTTLETQV